MAIITLARSKDGREPVPKRRSAPSGPTALGRWKIQFCHAERRAKIFVSIVSGPTKRLLASSPVRASGEKLARSSSSTRTSSSQSMSSKANVTSPASTASRGRQVLADAGRGRRPAGRRGPRSGSPAGVRPLRHRVPAVVGGRQPERGRRRRVVGVLPRAVEHQRAVGGQRQLGERAGEAAARLDEGDERAGRHVEALQRARPVQPDLAGQPVVVGEDRLGGGDGVGVAGRAQDPRAELGLVEAQMQDGVVELAGRGQHPRRRRRPRVSSSAVAGWRPVGPATVIVGGAERAVELDGDVLVARSRRRRRCAVERGERDAGTVVGTVGRGGPREGPLAHELVERAARGDGVDEAPLDGLLALDALGCGWRTRRRGRGARGACRRRGSARRCRAARPSSGTSGSETADERSSTSRISSQASASS